MRHTSTPRWFGLFSHLSWKLNVELKDIKNDSLLPTEHHVFCHFNMAALSKSLWEHKTTGRKSVELPFCRVCLLLFLLWLQPPCPVGRFASVSVRDDLV